MSLIPQQPYRVFSAMSASYEPTEVMLPERWRIPLEVCEKVIDEAGKTDWFEGYPTLPNCALVCRAWTPRSRIRLFQVANLTSEEGASKFLAVLSISPEYGQLVRTLYIDCSNDDTGSHGWIYQALRILPSLLTNVEELGYQHLPTLHTLFHVLSPKFTTIKSLWITQANAFLD
ncbi:hypothetical protein NLI96_g12755 [Meripilus lineatus]|uniref:Uncharacterized protein n=1 Tax=Meripilus lineatus TaxID=2056292 RepID=A0AAD5YC37_9APHY|nr:hypothetical protein NLI96_g12755 [Physisporinus lineatus]